MSENISSLHEVLSSIRQSVKNARGAIESNQVVDKDVHGTLTRVIAAIDAALSDPPPLPNVVPVVSVKTMRLGDGRTDYFVSIKVGNREVTPQVFREEYKAAYHVALYTWLLKDTDKPDLMAFDEGEWPAQATETLAHVEAEIASVVQSVNEWDDRTSPDDYPEHLLITSEELALILRNFAAALNSSEGK